jgi:hypothetical protein
MTDFWGLNFNYEDFDRLLKKEELEEEPVSLEVFVGDRKYLGLPPLSEVQLEIAKHITQIFKPHTLVQLHGEEKGLELYEKYTVNEVICMLGKGSGKDHTSRVSLAYITYLLHCLRDPLEYYNKSPGIYIDLLNLAVNAQQAQRVFFEPFKNLLLRSPYFNDVGFEPRVGEVFFFSRPIRCFSGHSESEGWEGYEVMVVVLDEIAAFKTDIELKGETRAKGSASAIYKMSKASIMSRFPAVGKVVLLSFPRFKGDFIEERYYGSIANNEPKTWGIKKATWEVNPTITREDLESEYVRNPQEARSRFECEPPEMEDAYFKEPDRVRAAFNYAVSPVESDGTWKPWFNGTDNFPRFIHVDLGLKRDKAALCMVHMSGMKEVNTGNHIETLPIINMDYITSWKAAVNSEVPFAEVRGMIMELCRKFNVAAVTFDYWQSADMIQSLRHNGINADAFTVKKSAYDTLSTTIYDGRLRGYWSEQLIEGEILKLRLINNTKIDHPSKGEKDMADALAGAVYMCMTNFGIVQDIDIEIWGGDDLDYEKYDGEAAIEAISTFLPNKQEPMRAIPVDLEEWLIEMI